MYERDLKQETDQRIETLRRTASECIAKAERLEKLRIALEPHPLSIAHLKRTLRRVDDVLDWCYIDALGELQVDADTLAERLDVETLFTIKRRLEESIAQKRNS